MSGSRSRFFELTISVTWVLGAFLSIGSTGVAARRPENPEWVMARAGLFEASLPGDCDEAAGWLDTFYLAIDVLRWDFKDTYSSSEADKRVKIGAFEAAIDRTIGAALALDSGCARAHLYRAWPAAQGMVYNDTLRWQALEYYRAGLRHCPRDVELKARLAYVLEISDSAESARALYRQLVGRGVKRLDIKQALGRIAMREKFRRRFFEAPEQNFVLLQRRPTYAGMDPPVPYCKVRADGRCEYFDYYAGSSEPLHFERRLDSAQVDSIIADLGRMRFLSIHNAFRNDLEGGADFAYVSQWHLPVYWTTFHADGFEHKVGVYGLGTIYGRNATRDVLSITYMRDLNVPRDSYVMDKIDSLGAWWSRVFSFDWVDRRIDSLYGTHRPVTRAPGVYRYDPTTDSFIRVSVPDLGVKWRAPRSTRSQIEPQDVEDGIIFDVNGVLYRYACSWGRLVYTLDRNAVAYPYFNNAHYRLFFGRTAADGLELKVHAESSGRYLFTATAPSDTVTPVVTGAYRLDRDDERDLAGEFRRFKAWLDDPGRRLGAPGDD